MTMLAIASKPRGDRSCVREMKLPAALLTRPVSGPLAENLLDHRFDCSGIADVDADRLATLAAMRLHELLGGRVADLLAPPADGDFGSERQEALGHRLAEPGAAAGDKNALA